MAVATVPKSEMRRKTSISYGYGEIPEARTEDGRTAWGLPGNVITYCYDEALAAAKKIDRLIRDNLKSPNQLCN